jgi:16S rRNA (guanine966-N2)-methyltransferase
MRIISGLARGLPLRTPRGRDVRPTLDRVRGSIFSSLGDIRGWTVVDLFAGTGALGLEAASRGATDVYLVENAARHLGVLEDNVAALTDMLGPASAHRVTVVRADAYDVTRALSALAGRVDLILADPPYASPRSDAPGIAPLLQSPDVARWAGTALAVFQHHRDTPLHWAPVTPWRLIQQRRFGITVVSFCRPVAPPPGAGPPPSPEPAPRDTRVPQYGYRSHAHRRRSR